MRNLHVVALLLGVAPAAALRLSAQSVAAPCPAAIAPSTASPAIVPVDISNNHVYVKVCARGRELEFILDTGAGATFLDLKTARQLGYKLNGSFVVRGAGAGTVEGARVQGGSVTIEAIGLEQEVGSALDLSNLPAREGHRMDGILGYDFIARNVLAIDYARSELRIYDRSRFLYNGAGSRVPIMFSDMHPNVDATVTLANGERIDGRFIVDVGAGSALSLTKPFVEEHHLRDKITNTVKRSGGGGVGGATTSDFGRVASLKIGAQELSRPITQLFGDSAGVFTQKQFWVGNIGGDVLRRFVVYFDYAAKTMILERGADFAEPFEADMSGMGAVYDDALTTVSLFQVVPASPAAEAGLMTGDVLVSIDGSPATVPAYRALRLRMRRSGERVTLVVRRGNETKTFSFVTRRLV